MNKSIRAGGIVLNPQNKIALSNEHIWGFPRGGVEQGETLEFAARREIAEETGLKNLKLVKSLGSYQRYPGGITKETPGSFPMEINMFLFTVDYTDRLVPESEKVNDADWFTFEEAIERLDNAEDKDYLSKVWKDIF